MHYYTGGVNKEVIEIQHFKNTLALAAGCGMQYWCSIGRGKESPFIFCRMNLMGINKSGYSQLIDPFINM